MINSEVNKDFTRMITPAIRSQYPDECVSNISRDAKIAYRTLSNILNQDEVPKSVISVKRLSEIFGLDHAELYQAYLRQSEPETLEWINNFDLESCDFAELVKYCRLSSGSSRDEMDTKLLITKRGDSLKYEYGERVPAPNNIEEIAKNLGLSQSIVLNAVARQWRAHQYRFQFDIVEVKYDEEDKPYVVESPIDLSEALVKRAAQMRVSYDTATKAIGADASTVVSLISDERVISIESLSQVAAWMNIDLFSLIDVYRESIDYTYLNANFGNTIYIICACLGMSISSITDVLIPIHKSTLWNYMSGTVAPKYDTLVKLSRILGIKAQVLQSMFENSCNYRYYKKYAYEAVRYIIRNNWKKLDNLNVCVIRQIFKNKRGELEL